MANFAQVTNNVVQNLIIADTLADAESVLGVGSCIELTDNIALSIGWTYNPETKAFSAPTE
jgi:hypothetical protein